MILPTNTCKANKSTNFLYSYVKTVNICSSRFMPLIQVRVAGSIP